MSNPCLIISGGAYSPLPAGFPSGLFTIACDRGFRHARRMGITPDLILGDFDSAERPHTDIPILQYPIEKDDTDTMLAVRYALSRHYDELHIACAMGGRLDHAFANIQTAAFAVKSGAVCHLYGETENITVFSNREMRFPREEGRSLAVFSLSDRCFPVSLRGTLYQAEGIELTGHFPLGMSNEWAAEEAVIHCGEGILMVMRSVSAHDRHLQDLTAEEKKNRL